MQIPKEHQEYTYCVVADTLALRPIGDRIIVLEDRHRTGYECKTCDGSGLTDEPCPQCKGTKVLKARRDDLEDEVCFSCKQDGFATGKKLCPDCKGKGATIIIPQKAERRTTTGVIVAIGEEVTLFKIGDHVLYGSYSGTGMQFYQKTIVRVLREAEALCRVFKTKDLKLGEVYRDEHTFNM